MRTLAEIEHDQRDHQRDLVAKLASTPEWQALRDAVNVQIEQVYARLAKKLIASGRRVDPDEIVREVTLAEGFFRGMKFVLDRPGASVNAIERELKEASSGEED